MSKRIKSWIVVLFGATLFLALLSVAQVMVWDGGFPSEKYELAFVDEAGGPVPGIELRVETPTGVNCHHYPITDCVPSSSPTSDAKGVLACHHIRDAALEFGGHCCYLFWFIPIGTCESPAYICRFELHGQEVFRCNFRDLKLRALPRPREITVEWNWEPWLASQPANRGESREEGVVALAVNTELMRREQIAHNPTLATEEHTMPVYQQKIVIAAQP